jgi:hypothetical protein
MVSDRTPGEGESIEARQESIGGSRSKNIPKAEETARGGRGRRGEKREGEGRREPGRTEDGRSGARLAERKRPSESLGRAGRFGRKREATKRKKKAEEAEEGQEKESEREKKKTRELKQSGWSVIQQLWLAGLRGCTTCPDRYWWEMGDGRWNRWNIEESSILI